MGKEKEIGLIGVIMPVATFEKSLLFAMLGYEPDDAMLKDQTGKMGLSIESIGAKELSVEFPSNRPDLLGTVGYARALKHFMHRSSSYSYKLGSQKPAADITIGVGVKNVRAFMSGLVVKNVKFKEETLKDTINFMEKLCDTYGRKREKIAIGMHNLDAIRLPLRYDLYGDEEFVPLNSNRSMKFSTVIKEHEKGLAYGSITEAAAKGKYVALKDSEGVIALIPILNSERTKVGMGTKNLFIDITGTSKHAIDKTADILAAMFLDIGFDVLPVNLMYKENKETAPSMESAELEIPVNQAEAEIGVQIGYRNIISLVNKMGYEGALVNKNIIVKVPVYRADVINEQDLIEDIAIAYGYDYIQPVPVPSIQSGELEACTIANRKASRVMAGLGFVELLNSFLTNEGTNFSAMRMRTPEPDSYVRIKNAVAASVSMMRTWLLPSLLKNVSMSKMEKMPQKIFELDLAFSMHDGTVEEDYHLAAIETGPRSNFNMMKSYLYALNDLLGLDLKLEAVNHRSFIEGRCTRINVGSREIGYMGEIHPETLLGFDIEEPTIAMEINLDGIDF